MFKKLISLVSIAAVFLVVIAGALPQSAIQNAVAGDEPTGVNLSSKFGVTMSVHESYDPDTVTEDLDRMKEMGVKWARIHFLWNELESRQGQWDKFGSLPVRDDIVRGCNARGIKVLGVLYGTPHWANGDNEWRYPPVFPAFKTQYDEYVFKIADRYDGTHGCGTVDAYEVWSEQNVGQWQPAPNANDYTTLLRYAAVQIHAAAPGADVVFGGVCTPEPDLPSNPNSCLSYVEQCLKAPNNAGEVLDAVSFHPYRAFPEEDKQRAWVTGLRALLNQYAPGRSIEIWVSELAWGCSAGSGTQSEEPLPGAVIHDDVSIAGGEREQAAFVLRSAINFADTELKHFNLYCLRETLFGNSAAVMLPTFRKLKSYYAYKCLVDTMGQATAAVPVPTAINESTIRCVGPGGSDGRGKLELHCFSLKNGSLAVAAWMRNEDAVYKLSFKTVSSTLGAPVRIDPETGKSGMLPPVNSSQLSVEGLEMDRSPNMPVIMVFPSTSPAPLVTCVTPSWGRKGVATNMTVYGAGFKAGSSVKIKNGSTEVAATDVTVASTGTIFCKIPSGPANMKYNVIVTNPGSLSSQLIRGFWVIPYNTTLSAITSTPPTMTPARGTKENESCEIKYLAGSGFHPAGPGESEIQVRLVQGQYGIEAENTGVISSGKIRCVFDLRGAPAGKYDIVVDPCDRDPVTIPATATTAPFEVCSTPTWWMWVTLAPNQGTNDTVYTVTIGGFNYRSGAKVKFIDVGEGGFDAPVTTVTGNSITCTADLTGARPDSWRVLVSTEDGYPTLNPGVLILLPVFTVTEAASTN